MKTCKNAGANGTSESESKTGSLPVQFECGEAHLFSDHVHPDIECNKTTGVCSQDLCCTQRTCLNSGAFGNASHMNNTGPYDCTRFNNLIQ